MEIQEDVLMIVKHYNIHILHNHRLIYNTNFNDDIQCHNDVIRHMLRFIYPETQVP